MERRGGFGVAPVTHTTQPYVTGSAVLGIRCADGVVLGSDTLVSYGSLAKNRRTSRLLEVSKDCVLGCSGEYSDFQQLKIVLESKNISEYCYDDGHRLSPQETHQYLSQVMYQKRNKMDPLWNQIVLGGFSKDKSYLGLVDLYGTIFESEVVATGYGLLLALPLLRKAYRPDLTVEEGKKVVEECLRVLFYRDARTIDTVQLATVTKDGVHVSDMFHLDSKWTYKAFVAGNRDVDASTW